MRVVLIYIFCKNSRDVFRGTIYFTKKKFKDENGGEGGKRGRVDVLELQVFLI